MSMDEESTVFITPMDCFFLRWVLKKNSIIKQNWSMNVRNISTVSLRVLFP